MVTLVILAVRYSVLYLWAQNVLSLHIIDKKGSDIIINAEAKQITKGSHTRIDLVWEPQGLKERS